VDINISNIFNVAYLYEFNEGKEEGEKVED